MLDIDLLQDFSNNSIIYDPRGLQGVIFMCRQMPLHTHIAVILTNVQIGVVITVASADCLLFIHSKLITVSTVGCLGL